MKKELTLLTGILLSALTGAYAEEKYTDQWIDQRGAFQTQRFDKRKSWWTQWLKERQDFEASSVQAVLDNAQKILDGNKSFLESLRAVPLDQRKDKLQQQALKDREAEQEFQSQQQIERDDFEKKLRQEQLDHMKSEHEEDADELRQEQNLTH